MIFIAILAIAFIRYLDLGMEERIEAMFTFTVLFGLITLIPVSIIQFITWIAKKRFIRLMTKYYDEIYKHYNSNISRIAEQVKQPAERVIEDIEYMIEKRILPYGTIEDGYLVLDGFSHGGTRGGNFKTGDNIININFGQNNINFEQNNTSYNNSETPEQKTKQPKVMDCPGCGAKMSLSPDESKECEYCGSTVLYA
ncbi:hypothetical protein MNQ98_07450 [Paenibacillus sp. N3/727]|uniref:hypothetical protein n=1 Tax=Paenibacillus sp. N3/727 TaxID=2925845 RepID=UPI001F5360C9|nr:hypothetical protein [Paenibacillus sp. N3/727]UNK19855.1 hypothetical protein MNQ98_07450 [Paenibacillus sp. N3/727]